MTIHRFKLKEFDSNYLQKLQQQFGDKDMDVEIRLLPHNISDGQENEMDDAVFWEIIHTLAWEHSEDNEAIL